MRRDLEADPIEGEREAVSLFLNAENWKKISKRKRVKNLNLASDEAITGQSEFEIFAARRAHNGIF